jgi:hypothetical protein
MADPLPPEPAWFKQVTADFQRVEKFSYVNGCSLRRKALERLKSSHGIEMSCQTGNPGTHYLRARLVPKDIDGELPVVAPPGT